MSILHFDPGIYVGIPTFSILLDIQTRHGGERDGSKRVVKKEGEEKINSIQMESLDRIVVISTSSILLDIQTRHGGDGSKRVDKDEMR